MFTAKRVGDPKDYIKGESGDWEIILGLEVHAQVASNSKLFSGAATEYGAEPNTQVSLVDAGMPGMLPVVNKFCVEQAVRTGLGLNAKIKRARLISSRLMQTVMSASLSVLGLSASIWSKMRVNPYMTSRQQKPMSI